VYFDGTATTGVTLPNGGILKVLHLPSTVTNLTILNQKNLTEFVLPSYANVSTLRIENTPNVDVISIVSAMAENGRVRWIGFDWEVDSIDDLYTFFEKIDTCRGLDEQGNNIDKAVLSGRLRVDTITYDYLVHISQRYPNVTVESDKIGYAATFMVDGAVYNRQVFYVGEQIKAPNNPTKESTVQYNYTFKGWSLDGVNVTTLGTMGEGNVTYYAVFAQTVRTYTIRFYNGTTLLQTQTVAYGTMPTYTGSTPSTGDADYAFVGWTPELAVVTGNADYVAKFVFDGSVARSLIKRTITECSNETVTMVGNYAFRYCSALTRVDLPNVTSIGSSAFRYCSALTSVDLPNVTSIGSNAFSNCKSMKSANLPNLTSANGFEFSDCTALEFVRLLKLNAISNNMFIRSPNLKTLILGSHTVCSLPSTNSSGGMTNGCTVYVPQALIESYKTATNWSTLYSSGKCNFVAIEGSEYE
jgi:hypothetical protein